MQLTNTTIAFLMSARQHELPRLTRGDLARALPALGREVNFLTMHELLSLHFAVVVRGDYPDRRVRSLGALELARQAPSRFVLEGNDDPVPPARGLAHAIRLERPSMRSATWMEIAAGCVE